MDPTPWDAYRYPPTPPAPALPETARAERLACEWLKRKLDGVKQPDAKPEQPALPSQGRRPVLPAPDVPPMLPAGVEMTQAALADPVRSGLFGATPLELLTAYLKSAGIRHFTAKELTRHKWRNASGRIVSGASAWWFVIDTFGAGITPRGPWFALPGHVVPDPALWPSILPALRVLDRFRHWLFQPVTVISGYRTAVYNLQIEGAADSRHKTFQACDFYYPFDRMGNDGKKRLNTDVFKAWFAHVYRGDADGVGVYDGFVHLDINTRGKGTGKAQSWDKRTG